MTKALLFLLTFTFVFSQRFSDGIPLIKNYDAKNYNSDQTNRDVKQDSKGILYFANNEGLLSFDGINWTITRIGDGKAIRSIDIDEYDNIYIGSINEFGVIKRNRKGILEYKSFIPLLDSTVYDMRDVWYVSNTSHGVYFQTRPYVFRYFDNKVTYHYTKKYPTHSLHKANDQIFTRRIDKGLARVDSDSLRTIENGEFFSYGNSPYIMIPHNNSYLFGTRKFGLFTFNNGSVSIFNNQVNDRLKEALLYRGIVGKNGEYYIATLQDGIFNFNKEGQLLNHIGREKGLNSSDIKMIYEANDKAMWVGMEKGMARINYTSAFRFFDKRLGIVETADEIFRFKDKLYVSTNNGTLTWNGNKFEKVIGTSNITQEFGVVEGELYVASEKLFKINGNRATVDNEQSGNWYIFYSKKYKTGLLAGPSGPRLYDFKTKDHHFIEEARGRNTKAYQVNDNEIYLVTNNGKLTKITITGYMTYKAKDLIPKEEVTYYADFYYWQGRLHVNTPKSIYIIEEDQLTKDTLLTSYLPDQFKTPFITESFGDNIIFTSDGQLGFLKKTEQGFEFSDKSFRLINDDLDINSIYADDDSTLWISTSDGIINYNPKYDIESFSIPKVSINRMILNTDSVLQSVITSDFEITEGISYSLNKIRFEFGAPNYDRPELTKFRYLLKGETDEWSNWSSESYIDLRNIYEGRYDFKLQAKDIYGTISETLTVSFTIVTPFYRNAFSYTIYFIIFILLIIYVIKIRTASLVKEKEKLELIVEERTAKIKQQAEKLKVLDEAKTKFFTNISHEIRTPLTLMLSPLEDVLPKIDDEEIQNKLGIVKRNTSRLFQLITQILDISKIESKSLPINMVKGDVIPLIRELISSFAGVTDHKGIKVHLECVSNELITYVDQDKFEKIFFNIFSNAVKNSPNGSALNVSIGKPFKKFEKINTETHYQLSIQDFGEGIPADQIEQIFARYYQVETTESKKAIGSGIGLSLVKELIELLHGRIRVFSTVGKGTTFEIYFPIDASLYPESDISSHQIHDFTKQNAEFYFNYEIGLTPELKKELKKEDIHKETQIVIIEDNIELNSYLKQYFDHFFTVHSADNGQSGLELIKEIVPDLIISDVMMPIKDGYQLTREIRSNADLDHIPIILLTAKSASEERIEGLEHGANDYVTKPFNAKELQLRIHNILSYRDKLRDKFDNNILLEPSEFTENSQEENFLNHANKIIEDHLSDMDFSVEQFCKEIGMSRTNLHRKLKYLTNKSTTDYIRSVKLKFAVQMLLNKAGSISEIAYQAGFNSVSYFNKIFKSTFNKSPKEYLQAYQNQTS